MYVVINTTSPPATGANNPATSYAMRQKSLDRLSSGVKIVRPADDADSLTVSIKRLASRRQSTVAVATSNAVSLLETQEGALKLSGKLRERMNVRRLRPNSSNKKLNA